MLMLGAVMVIGCGGNGGNNTEIFDMDEVVVFLEKVYPNSLDEDELPDRAEVTTERFREWCSLVCDYDPIYKTQDAYAYDILPDPSFSKYEPYPNAYAVSWKRYEQSKSVVNYVVVTKVDDRYLIDNILELDEGHFSLLFDYAVKPESIWGD